SAVVFSARSAIMSATTTTAPASPSARAQAAPIPCPPPVTTATRPSSINFSRYIALPRSLHAAFAVETMNMFRLRRHPDAIADVEAELARGADGYPADPVDGHIEES